MQKCGEWEGGDILKIEVDLLAKYEMNFEKNGKYLEKLKLRKGQKYYPAVSLYYGQTAGPDEMKLIFD